MEDDAAPSFLAKAREEFAGIEIDMPRWLDAVDTLTPYAVVLRYEVLDPADGPDPNEMHDLAVRVHNWATTLMGLDAYAPPNVLGGADLLFDETPF